MFTFKRLPQLELPPQVNFSMGFRVSNTIYLCERFLERPGGKMEVSHVELLIVEEGHHTFQISEPRDHLLISEQCRGNFPKNFL